MVPKFLTQKIRDGVVTLESVPFCTLMRWAGECVDPEDKDLLGDYLMYVYPHRENTPIRSTNDTITTPTTAQEAA